MVLSRNLPKGFKFVPDRKRNDYFMRHVMKEVKLGGSGSVTEKSYVYQGEVGNINAVIGKDLQDVDLVHIVRKGGINDVPKDVRRYMGLYPVIWRGGVSMTPIVFKQVNGILDSSVGEGGWVKMVKNLVGRAMKMMGAVIVGGGGVNIDRKTGGEIDMRGWREIVPDSRSLGSEVGVIKIDSRECRGFETTPHGWLSNDTKRNLDYAVRKFKVKNVLELGAWYGLSTRFIRERLKEEGSNIYSVDFYQNICHTPYDFRKPSPLDKFYFTYPRLETFYKNLYESSGTAAVWIVKHDADKVLGMMKKYGIQVDMVFIDCFKRTDVLLAYLEKLEAAYPNAVVVGDDHVFVSVQQSLLYFISQHSKFVGILKESYLLSGSELVGYRDVYAEADKERKEQELIISGKRLVNDKDKIVFVADLIDGGKFNEAFEKVVGLKVRMNLGGFLRDRSTVYHVLARSCYEHFKGREDEKYQVFNKFVKCCSNTSSSW